MSCPFCCSGSPDPVVFLAGPSLLADFPPPPFRGSTPNVLIVCLAYRFALLVASKCGNRCPRALVPISLVVCLAPSLW